MGGNSDAGRKHSSGSQSTVGWQTIEQVSRSADMDKRLVGCLVALSLSAALLSAATFQWRAGLLSGNLIVVIDTTASAPNLVIEDASFNATFFDAQGRALGNSRNFSVPVNQITIGQRQTFP